MKNRRIVIASVLKPVDDTRMLEKMGATLAAEGHEVYILGYPSLNIPVAGSLHLQPSGPFQRISLTRIFEPFRIFRKVYQLKPGLLIVNTHELLVAAVWIKIFTGAKIIYDIRENYYRNILHTSVFPKFLRPLLAGWVRIIEKLTALFFNGFLLAEKGYALEMNFFGNRAVIVENKASMISTHKHTREASRIRLLFSGTLAESTGVFEAIRLAVVLHQADPTIQLSIIGYCAVDETLKKINQAIQDHPFISLTGGDKLVPHPEIIRAIENSDFGIICYPASAHTQNSIPTKLYEYLAGRLPILLQQYPAWTVLCVSSNASISVDFENVNAADVLARMNTNNFYTSTPEGVTWAPEGAKLLELIARIKKA